MGISRNPTKHSSTLIRKATKQLQRARTQIDQHSGNDPAVASSTDVYVTLSVLNDTVKQLNQSISPSHSQTTPQPHSIEPDQARLIRNSVNELRYFVEEALADYQRVEDLQTRSDFVHHALTEMEIVGEDLAQTVREVLFPNQQHNEPAYDDPDPQPPHHALSDTDYYFDLNVSRNPKDPDNPLHRPDPADYGLYNPPDGQETAAPENTRPSNLPDAYDEYMAELTAITDPSYAPHAKQEKEMER